MNDVPPTLTDGFAAKQWRILAGGQRPYHAFNREERHLAAVLFHLLSHRRNVELLFALAGIAWPVDESAFGVYFEYSYLRDLWHVIGARGAGANDVKRRAIIAMLKAQGFDAARGEAMAECGTKAFNTVFVGKEGASELYVQSPANWRLAEFVRTLPEDGDLVAACKIKWAFKAKPDIVIHADHERVVCLELKLESIEGTYPAAAAEKKLLRARGLFDAGGKGLFPIAQCAIQRLAVEDLLGFECHLLYVTPREDSAAGVLSWRELHDGLDCRGLPPYMAAALALASCRGAGP
jgi:hypothetical protein